MTPPAPERTRLRNLKFAVLAAALAAGETPSPEMVAAGRTPPLPVGASLPILLVALVLLVLFGIAITLAGERGKHVLSLFDDLDAVIMRMVEIIMRLAPYGVFALIARTFATQGLDLITPLLAYFLTLTGALGLHALVTYPTLLRLLAGASVAAVGRGSSSSSPVRLRRLAAATRPGPRTMNLRRSDT